MSIIRQLHEIGAAPSGIGSQELAELIALGRAVVAVYAEHQATPPGPLTQGLSNAETAFKVRCREELLRKLELAKSRRATLLTQAEQRKIAEAEIAALEASLGL